MRGRTILHGGPRKAGDCHLWCGSHRFQGAIPLRKSGDKRDEKVVLVPFDWDLGRIGQMEARLSGWTYCSYTGPRKGCCPSTADSHTSWEGREAGTWAPAPRVLQTRAIPMPVSREPNQSWTQNTDAASYFLRGSRPTVFPLIFPPLFRYLPGIGSGLGCLLWRVKGEPMTWGSYTASRWQPVCQVLGTP